MADFRTQAVTPAAISYTPLDLSRIQARLGQKVQEVEAGAAAGRNLITSLDFKDGYMLSGLAKKKQAEYSDKINNLVEGLYSTGDTRSFTQDLSLLANQINTDEDLLAGQKDFEMSKVHDTYSMDPTKRAFYYGYTSDNSSTGDIAPADWQNNNYTREDVMNFYKVYPGEDLRGEYGERFDNLSSIQFEEYIGQDPATGMYTFKTTKGPEELPQGIAGAYQEGLTKEEAVAQALLMENPGLYRQLESDYDKGGSNSAINYRDARGLSKEHFIGATVLENLPYLMDTQYSLQNPPKDSTGGGGSDAVVDTVDLKTTAFTTVFDNGVGSEVMANTGLTPQAVSEVLGFGYEDDMRISHVLADPDANPEEVAQVSFYVAGLNDFMNYGDSARPDLYTNGKELKAAADEATASILTSVNRPTFSTDPLNEDERLPAGGIDRLGSFTDIYAEVIGDQNPVDFFHKILNTRLLLGQTSAQGFDLNDKENLINDYDGMVDNPALAQHLTFGVGYLTPDELKGVLNIQGQEQYFTELTGPDALYSNLGEAINRYHKASDGFVLPNGKYRRLNRGMPFQSDLEPMLSELKNTNPIAFYEAARADLVGRMGMYHTDVRVSPGEILSREVTEKSLEFTAQEFGVETPGSLAANWELSKIIVPESGGGSGTKSTGAESPRLSLEKGKQTIVNPYQEVEWSDLKAQTWLKDFQKWGAGDDNDGKLNFGFHGLLMPGGRSRDTGLIISETKDGKTTQWLLQPKTNTAMENNALFKQMKVAQKNLTGKRYLPKVTTGDAYINQVGLDIYKSVQEDVDLRDVSIDYAYTDTKGALSGTLLFDPQEQIRTNSADGTTVEVDNIYFDGTSSVVADIQEGQEVYRIRKKDGTGDVSWGEYLNTFQEDIADPSNTYLGVQDYKDFLISLYMNVDYINDNGGTVNRESVVNLLSSPTMLSVQKMIDTVGADWNTLTNIPITFVGKKDALYHFAGQPGDRGKPDQYGLPQSGYIVK